MSAQPSAPSYLRSATDAVTPSLDRLDAASDPVRVLLYGGDAGLAAALQAGIDPVPCSVTCTRGLPETMERLQRLPGFDLLVYASPAFEVELPDLLRQVHMHHIPTPVLVMMPPEHHLAHEVRGLELGAAAILDHDVKPVVLSAHIRAILRRRHTGYWRSGSSLT